MAKNTAAYKQLLQSGTLPDFACDAIAQLFRDEEAPVTVNPNQSQVLEPGTSTVHYGQPANFSNISSAWQSVAQPDMNFYMADYAQPFYLPPLVPFSELVRAYPAPGVPEPTKGKQKRNAGGARKRKNNVPAPTEDTAPDNNNFLDDAELGEFLVLPSISLPEQKPKRVTNRGGRAKKTLARPVASLSISDISDSDVQYVLRAKDAKEYLPLPKKHRLRGVMPHKGFWAKCYDIQFNSDKPNCTGRVTVCSRVAPDGHTDSFYFCNVCGHARATADRTYG
ncbi:hypothetical protein AAVH_20420 [Aphelenchoides avenae]|nr:hypothetical protein AAVH_20420 [Aphelenchus avenae]